MDTGEITPEELNIVITMKVHEFKLYVRGAAGILSIIFLWAGLIHSQVRSAAEGGSRGGYGKVYESAGKSAAGREVQKKMSTMLQSAAARSRKPSRPATDVSRSSRSAGSRALPGKTTQRQRNSPVAVVDDSPNHAVFEPVSGIDVYTYMADSIGTTPVEKAALRQLFSATKTAFEQEVAAKGRKNNLAAAFTFFIAATTTVYHDDPEPSDAAVDNLWSALDTTFDESPDFANLSNREKQELYDTVIALGGLAYAGYLEGKNSGDQDTVEAYRKISGNMIELVLKTKPENIRFRNEELVIKQ